MMHHASLILVQQMAYLYQFGEQRSDMYTLETSREGVGVLAALANLKLFGKEGLRMIIGDIVEMASF
jgi:glutamate/tyrosine decarboxylase-like PLP-dependent enzyme